MQVAIRTDASPMLGLGHLSRCLTLAGELCVQGATTTFICNQLMPELVKQIESAGHRLRLLNGTATVRGEWRDDARRTAQAIVGIGAPLDWLVVDHYALDQHWETVLRPAAGRILVIDDLADRNHNCDLLLDQNLQVLRPDRYAGRVPMKCRLLLGPRFALLRNEFRDARAQVSERVRSSPLVLISMGGSDPTDETSKTLQSCLQLDAIDVAIDVVVGASYSHLDKLRLLVAGNERVSITVAVADMAQRLLRATLAIGAGGVSMWERCSLGVPMINIALAANQEEGAWELARAGASIYLGRASDAGGDHLRSAVATLLFSPALRSALAERASRLADGAGVSRVVRAMMLPSITIRSAVSADRDDVLRWRNHPHTRRFSIDPNPVTEEEHVTWFASVLKDSSRHLLIAESEGRPVGVVRYDIVGKEADVSIYMVPDFAGRGLAQSVLVEGEGWLATHAPTVKNVRAVVREDNVASLSVFQAAGYCRHHLELKKELLTDKGIR